MAVAGTPDPGPDNPANGDCNTTTAQAVVNTGSRWSCVSRWGTYDMVGNVWEWTADWVPESTHSADFLENLATLGLFGGAGVNCPGWGGFTIGGDHMCFAGADVDRGPGVLIRGGGFDDGGMAGPLAISAAPAPPRQWANLGFRCAR